MNLDDLSAIMEKILSLSKKSKGYMSIKGQKAPQLNGPHLYNFKQLAVFFVLFFSVSLSSYSQPLRRVHISKISNDEEKVLDYFLDFYIPIISLETPTDRKKFKKKLREWNPKIKDWTKLDNWDKIRVFRKSPLYDLSLGYHAYDNTEVLDIGGRIITKVIGPTFDTRITFVHDLTLFSYLNFKLMKKNEFQLEDDPRIYKFPMTYFIEYGRSWASQFNVWMGTLSASWEQLSFISFNNERFKVRSQIMRNLQVSTTETLWFNVFGDYRFTMFKKGTYLRLGGGYSPLGTKSLDDGSKEEKITSYKGLTSLKYYIHHKVWLKGYFQYAHLAGKTRTNQMQYGLYVGYTL